MCIGVSWPVGVGAVTGRHSIEMRESCRACLVGMAACLHAGDCRFRTVFRLYFGSPPSEEVPGPGSFSCGRGEEGECFLAYLYMRGADRSAGRARRKGGRDLPSRDVGGMHARACPHGNSMRRRIVR